MNYEEINVQYQPLHFSTKLLQLRKKQPEHLSQAFSYLLYWRARFICPSYKACVTDDNKKLWQKHIFFKSKTSSDNLKKPFYQIGSFLQEMRVFRIIWYTGIYLSSLHFNTVKNTIIPSYYLCKLSGWVSCFITPKNKHHMDRVQMLFSNYNFN